MKCSMTDCQRAPMATGLARYAMCEAHVRASMSSAFAPDTASEPVAWWQRARARTLPTRVTDGLARDPWAGR